MKKQKLVLTGLVGFAFLFGCNQVEPTNEVKASLPNGFELITEDEYDDIYQNVYTLKNIATGCHYTLTDRSHNGGIIQMFIEKDGVSVPYCDKVGE